MASTASPPPPGPPPSSASASGSPRLLASQSHLPPALPDSPPPRVNTKLTGIQMSSKADPIGGSPRPNKQTNPLPILLSSPPPPQMTSTDKIGGAASSASPPPPGPPPSSASGSPRLLASQSHLPPALPDSRPPRVNTKLTGRQMSSKADPIGGSTVKADLVPVGPTDSNSNDEDLTKKGADFIKGYYSTLEGSSQHLHELYKKRCMVSWTILQESFQMKSAKEVQQKIKVLANKPMHFDLKHYEVHDVKKLLHIFAYGTFTLNTPNYFTQSLVVHHSSLILSDVLVINPDVCCSPKSRSSVQPAIGNPEVSRKSKFRFSVKTASRNSTENKVDTLLGKPKDVAGGHSRVMLVYNSEVLDHIPPPISSGNDEAHLENPGRIRSIIDKLEEDGLIKRVWRQSSGPAEQKDVIAIHSQGLVSAVEALPMTAEMSANCPFVSKTGIDMYASAGSRKAIYYAVGAVLKACDSVMGRKCQHAFALVRPPGHHASSAFAEGYCYFNNAAIAVNHLQTVHKVENVALVDIDTHHGNGSQSIFFSNNNVLVFSTHCTELNYPAKSSKVKLLSSDHTAIGEGAGRGFNVNVPMKYGYGDADVLHAIDQVLLPLLKTFKPGAIVVSAGFDGAEGEGFGGEVSGKCYGTIVDKLGKAGNGQLILCLEGGYNHKVLPDCVSHVIRSLLGDGDACLSEEELLSLHSPRQETQDTVRKLKKFLKKYWNVDGW